MDKVRAFMKVLWIQRFWVLSVVGVLAAAVCWLMASGALQAEYQTDKSAILAKFSEMDAIRNKPFHGNAVINAKEREEAVKIAENVQTLWRRLYDHQREEVLYWPEEHLKTDFIEHIEKKKFDSQISNEMRDRYLNYIQNRFDALVEIVDAQKMAADATSFSGGEMRGREMAFQPAAMPGQPGFEEDYLVQWFDQGALRAKLQFGRRPTSREVWVRQEDLWVYETLLRVIAATNEERGANRPDNTAIRIIEALEVGAEAARANAEPGNILMPAGADPSALGIDGGRAEFAAEGRPMYGEGFGEAADPAAADAALLAERYVDNEGKPIADPAAGLGVEYRRLPVRMRLMMDPRWIPKVLVECANAPLPVEVQRLRINPEKSGAGFDAPTTGGYGGEGGGRGFGGGGGRGYGGGEFSSYTPSLTGVPASGLVTVELQGLVYIYNPPDDTVLTVPGGDELAATESVVR